MLEKKQDYEALSEFRYQLRRFLHFSESAARHEGITPLQYLLLLHVRGFPGRDWASVGELAERLQLQQHGVVALISRCEDAGLVRRQKKNLHDRRLVEVHLLPAGAATLERLATLHEAELQSLQDVFRVARITAFNDADVAPPAADKAEPRGRNANSPAWGGAASSGPGALLRSVLRLFCFKSQRSHHAVQYRRHLL